MQTLEACKVWVVWGALAASVLAVVVALTWNATREAYAKASPMQRVLFFVGVAAVTLYAGSKGTVSYPRTDPSVAYLTNTGSYVTNDYVHVAFTKSILVPLSASFFIDRCEIAYTSDADIAAHTVNSYSNTFANLPAVPFDHLFAAATNYNWFVYTDWTPPPVVHTNGVAYVVWQIGATSNRLATTRTGVYERGVKLAPNPAITNLPPITTTLSTTNQED